MTLKIGNHKLPHNLWMTNFASSQKSVGTIVEIVLLYGSVEWLCKVAPT